MLDDRGAPLMQGRLICLRLSDSKTHLLRLCTPQNWEHNVCAIPN
jgi:hypothetical protein